MRFYGKSYDYADFKWCNLNFTVIQESFYENRWNNLSFYEKTKIKFS